MNRLFLLLLTIGLSVVPATAMDHAAPHKTEDPVTFLFNLFNSKQLKREEIHGQYSLNGEACKKFVELYWNDMLISSSGLLQNNNNLAFEDLENIYAALWLAEKCSIDVKNNFRAKTAQSLREEIVQHNRNFIEDLIPQALQTSEPFIIEQALAALDLLKTHLSTDTNAMQCIRKNRPLLREKARQNAPIGKQIIDLFKAGALNMSTSDQLWQTDKDKMVVGKEAQDRLCGQFCTSYKAFIINAAESLPEDPGFWKLNNAFAALRYLHGCEALLSGAVLRGEEMSDAQKTGTQLVERFRAILKKEVANAQTSTAANFTLFAGIEACDIFHFFGSDAEKITYRKTGEELKERLANLEKPKKDDSSMPKPVEKKYTSVISRSSNVTIKKALIGGFTLAALAAASWFAYDRYGKKKGPGAQPRPKPIT